MSWRGTPGPWIAAPAASLVYVPDRGTVAAIGTLFPLGDLEERAANVRGIAAVPKLVEALLAIRETTAKQQLPITSQVHELATEALRAAGVLS